MITIDEGLKKIARVVGKGYRHKDYARTVEYAAKCRALVTGEGIDDFLLLFTPRESSEMFDQRKRITQAINPAINSILRKTFNKVHRVEPSIVSMDWKDGQGEADQRYSRVKKAANQFYAGENIEKYLQDRVDDIIWTDPNSFICIDFKEFDPINEFAKPYPIEVDSAHSLDYEYSVGILQYLISSSVKSYQTKDGEKKGTQYTAWLGEYVIVLNPIEMPTNIGVPRQIPGFILDQSDIPQYYYKSSSEIYSVSIFNPKASSVQAIRVGYELDPATDGRTVVSPLHPSLPYQMKMIKTVSESDITECLHVFPQKIQYVQACAVSPIDNICRTSGEYRDSCSKCGGTGRQTITSGQDMITFDLPDDPKDAFNLEQMLVYKTLPIDLPKYLNEKIELLVKQAFAAMFNSETFTKTDISATATGLNLDLQNVYDTLYDYSGNYSRLWVFFVLRIADFVDAGKDIEITHRFPKDFKLKTVSMLLAERKAAADSGASSYILQEIDRDIMRQMYIDRPADFIRLETKMKFYPFPGKSDYEIQTLLSTPESTTKRNILLYNNFDYLFEEIENDMLLESTPVWFYDLAYTKQREILDKYLVDLQTEIEEENRLAIDMRGAIPGADGGGADAVIS